MVEFLAPSSPLRVIDMDPDNIGSREFQIAIGSSLACFSLNALVSSALKLSQGFVQMNILIPLCIGTLIGS